MFIAGSAGAAAQMVDTPLKIGLSLPLSGNAGPLARQFEKGARKALEDLSTDKNIEIVIADDGCDEEIAGLAAQDLRAARVSIVTGLVCNAAVRAHAQEFQDDGVPILIAGARSERLLKDAEKEGWHLWRMAPSDDDAAQAAHRIFSQRWRTTPWAIIDDGTVYGRTLGDALRALMEESGQPPQFADNFRPAQSTQAGLIRRLRQSGVSAAFIAAGPEDVSTIWSNRNEFGGNFEIAGGEALGSLNWLDAAGDIEDGLLAVLRSDPRRNEKGRKLALAFADAKIEPDEYAFMGYTAVQIALAALRRTPEETRAALDDTVFNTVTGIYAFGPDGARRGNDYALHVWRGGKFVPVGDAGE